MGNLMNKGQKKKNKFKNVLISKCATLKGKLIRKTYELEQPTINEHDIRLTAYKSFSESSIPPVSEPYPTINLVTYDEFEQLLTLLLEKSKKRFSKINKNHLLEILNKTFINNTDLYKDLLKNVNINGKEIEEKIKLLCKADKNLESYLKNMWESSKLITNPYVPSTSQVENANLGDNVNNKAINNIECECKPTDNGAGVPSLD